MHFIYFSIATFVALAVASPAGRDRASLSGRTVQARKLVPTVANERRQFEWLYDDEEYDDYLGDFDTGVSDNTAKRRALRPAGSKDTRQLEWFYDEEDYYDDYIGDFDTGVSDNAAKAKAKRQQLTT